MHLSPFTPEEAAYVARTMADNGALDKYIGASLMYHVHDRNNDRGVSIQVLRDDDGSRNGVVVMEQPDEHYPESIQAQEKARQREFGVPDDFSVPNILPVEDK